MASDPKSELFFFAKQEAKEKPLTPEELAQDGLVIRLIGQFALDVEAQASMMLGVNLTTDEGVKRALLQQGKLLGTTSILDQLADMILEGRKAE